MRQRSLRLSPALNTLDLDALIGVMARDHGLILSKSDPAMAMLTGFDQVTRAVCAHLTSEIDAARESIADTAAQQVEDSKAIAERIVQGSAADAASKVDLAIQHATPTIQRALIQAIDPSLTEMRQLRHEAGKAYEYTCYAAGGILLTLVLWWFFFLR